MEERALLMRSTDLLVFYVVYRCNKIKGQDTDGILSSVNSQRVAVLACVSAAVSRISAVILHVNLRFNL